MGMRITTGMAMNTYRYNLQNSTANMTNSRNKVLSHRKFDSFAEDPSSAIQAWRVRRAMMSTNSYQKNNSDTYTRINIAWVTMGTIKNKIADPDGRMSDLYAANGPTGSARRPLGQVIDETAESVIQAMNSAKSGENFIFAGDDELNAPFTWNGDRTILYYRGVNVNAGGVKSPAEAPEWAPKGADGKGVDNTNDAALARAFKNNIPASESDADREWENYYKDTTGTVAKPTGTAPSWVPKDGAGQPVGNTDAELAQAFKDSLPAKDSTEYAQMSDAEQAWINYYKDDPAGSLKPDAEPAWAAGDKDDFGVPLGMKAALDDPNVTAHDKAWAAYYKDQGDVQKLKEMSEEEANIDLGMGLLEDADGKLVPGTYFNRALPGINMLGFGVDEDGDPKNICMILKRLGEIYSACDGETGDYASDQDQEDAMRLLNKLKDGVDYITDQYSDIDAKGAFLQQNETRLDMQGDYLAEQRAELEDVDLADAITAFSWDYYCYSAALKVGTQLLSQSLIDYMS